LEEVSDKAYLLVHRSCRLIEGTISSYRRISEPNLNI